MKEIDQTLWAAIFESGNLRRAWKQVRANRGAPGIDGRSVTDFPAWMREHWSEVRARLESGHYRPAPVRRVEIDKPSGGKRPLGIPTVLDRVIQQAIAQVLGNKVDGSFHPRSYGFRPGKSAHQAIKQVQADFREGQAFAVDLDLEKFFDRVNHEVLLRLLRRRLHDPRVLRLIGHYLRSGVQLPEGRIEATREGVPQGGPLCQRPPALPFGQRLRPLAISLRSVRPYSPISCSTSWTGNWTGAATASFVMRMTSLSS